MINRFLAGEDLEKLVRRAGEIKSCGKKFSDVVDEDVN